MSTDGSPPDGAKRRALRRSPMSAALAQWRALYALVAVLVIAGVAAVLHLPEQVYPTLSFSRVLVLAQNGDLAPSLVQASIAHPLEQQLAAVLGVQQVVANSTQGAAAISITFDPSVADINVALQRVSTAVSSVQSRLPKGTDVVIQQVDPNLFPVLGYALSSNHLSSMRLREAAQYQVRPQLLGLPGVSLVTVAGGDVRVPRIGRSAPARRAADYGRPSDGRDRADQHRDVGRPHRQPLRPVNDFGDGASTQRKRYRQHSGHDARRHLDHCRDAGRRRRGAGPALMVHE